MYTYTLLLDEPTGQAALTVRYYIEHDGDGWHTPRTCSVDIVHAEYAGERLTYNELAFLLAWYYNCVSRDAIDRLCDELADNAAEARATDRISRAEMGDI